MVDNATKITNQAAQSAAAASVAEDAASYAILSLEGQYGPLFPVSTLEGTVEIYDAGGELIAVVSAEGEVEILCDDGPPVDEALCDPMQQSCPGLPEEEQFTYYDPWLEEDCGQALSNQSKLFSDSSEIYTGFLDEAPKVPKVQSDSIAEIPIFEERDDIIPDPFEHEIPRDEGTKALEKGPDTEVASNVASSGGLGTESQSQVEPQVPTGSIAPAAQQQMPGATAGFDSARAASEAASAHAFSEARSNATGEIERRERGVRRSVENAADAALSAIGRFVERAEESAGPALSEASRHIRSWIRAIFSHGGNCVLAEAEKRGSQGDSSLEAGRPRERGDSPAVVPFRNEGGLSEKRGSSGMGSLPAGGLAMHDPNSDPFSIAMSHMDKGGPPYFLHAASLGMAAPASGHGSSHDRVLAARSQGDAHHHHGEQEGDGRGDDGRQEYEPEIEDEERAIA
ncbi:MAG: hypothetical protein JXA24_03530 [Proteobacteria bacterium]|nr:hypothetical protein [Pseudomonadota bacterium]